MTEEKRRPPEPAPTPTPVDYTGGTQAKAADVMHVEGREPRAWPQRSTLSLDRP